MGFFRREPDAIATLSFFERADGRHCALRWVGDESWVPHLTSAVLDKLLANMVGDKRGAHDLLDRFEEFVSEATTYARAGDSPPLAGLAQLHDTYVGTPDGEITVRLLCNYARQNFGATTNFRPRRLADRRFAELALWTCWDWTCAVLDASDHAVTDVLENLAEQCAYYRRHGLPKMTTLGRAPFHAMASGSTRRLRDEIGAQAGLTDDELMELSAEDRQELIEAHTERNIARAAALADKNFTGYVQDVAERFKELWATPKNPIRRHGPEPDDRELTIIKRVAREQAMQQVLNGVDDDGSLDPETALREDRISAQVMACGYLWREAERGDDTSVIEPARSAVEFMRDRGLEDSKTPAEKLDMAVTWTLEGFSGLGFSPRDRAGIDGELVLELAFPWILDFVCDAHDTTPAALNYLTDDLQRSFAAGIALREVEPLFTHPNWLST